MITFAYRKAQTMEGTKDLNRIKVVLAERKRTNKWLSEQLKVSQSTVSKWCTNTVQPDLANIVKISKLLDVNLTALVRVEDLGK